MLSATTEKVEISERFLVTMRHGEEAEVPNDQSCRALYDGSVIPFFSISVWNKED
jgi:hypothetical protein